MYTCVDIHKHTREPALVLPTHGRYSVNDSHCHFRISQMYQKHLLAHSQIENQGSGESGDMPRVRPQKTRTIISYTPEWCIFTLLTPWPGG